MMLVHGQNLYKTVLTTLNQTAVAEDATAAARLCLAYLVAHNLVLSDRQCRMSSMNQMLALQMLDLVRP